MLCCRKSQNSDEDETESVMKWATDVSTETIKHFGGHGFEKKKDVSYFNADDSFRKSDIMAISASTLQFSQHKDKVEKQIRSVVDKLELPRRKGRIQMISFMDSVEQAGITMSEFEKKELKSMEDSKGTVSKENLVVFMMNSEICQTQYKKFEKLAPTKFFVAFKYLDSNKNGLVSLSEFRKLGIPDEKVELLYSRLDSDGDGELGYLEFRHMMMKGKAHLKL